MERSRDTANREKDAESRFRVPFGADNKGASALATGPPNLTRCAEAPNERVVDATRGRSFGCADLRQIPPTFSRDTRAGAIAPCHVSHGLSSLWISSRRSWAGHGTSC